MLVAELFDRLTLNEFIYWRAVYSMEPFGEKAGYYQAAQIQSAIINVNRRKGSQPVSIEDCTLKFKQPTTKPAPNLLFKLNQMTAKINSKFSAQDKAPNNGE